MYLYAHSDLLLVSDAYGVRVLMASNAANKKNKANSYKYIEIFSAA
jgi:hypothetical protein